MSINDAGLITLSYNGQYPGDTKYSNAAGEVGEFWLDTGHTTNVTSPRFYWRVRRPQATAATTTGTNYEQFRLPAATAGTAASATYEILTTKSTITVAQGGTGITTSTYKNAIIAGNASTATNAFQAIRTNNGAFFATAQDGAPSFGTLPTGQGGTGNTTGTATYATTAIDTSSTLYPIGVTSAATTTLKRDTSITMTGGAISATSLTLTGALTVGGVSTFNGKLISGTSNYGTSLPSAPSEGQVFFQISNPIYELPTGGTTGQALVKNSSGERDVKWDGPYLPLTGGHMTGTIHYDVAGVARQAIPSATQNGAIDFRAANGVDCMATLQYIRYVDTGKSCINLYIVGDGPSGSNEYGGIYIERDYQDTSNNKASYNITTGRFSAQTVAGAIWNDYAEFRKDNIQQKAQQTSGRCVVENGDGTLSLSINRLQAGAEIITDTYGFSIGEDKENSSTTPLAVSGRVLAYPYESIDEFKNNIGAPVCSGPNGTVSIMTAEEEKTYPSRIIGTISEIPTYERWGTGNVEVNGRIWIRVR